MTRDRDKWCKEIIESGAELYCLEKDGDFRLYEMKSQYEHQYNFYYTQPYFYIWKGNDLEYATTFYRDAIEIYERVKNEE